VPSTWMRYMINAAAKRSLVPEVDDVENERRVDRNSRVQATGRLPSSVPHAGDELAGRACRVQRNPAAVARDEVPRVDQSADLHLEPFDRRVDVSYRSARAGLLAEHVPGLERLTQLEVDAAPGDRAVERKPELQMRREPLRLE